MNYTQSSPVSRFRGKVAVITGADTLIGAATCRRFFSEGASVVMNGCQETLREIVKGQDWRRLLWHEGDIKSQWYVSRLINAAVEKFGRIDSLVINAEPLVLGPFLDITAGEWHQVMATTVDSVFFSIKEALPYLIETGGSVITVLSAYENGRDSGGGAYRAARGTITRLSRSIALELASEGVRLNVVSPRLTSTKAARQIPPAEHDGFRKSENIPIGRSALPEEVAAVVTFLASRDANFVNGVELPVDGGFSTIDRP